MQSDFELMSQVGFSSQPLYTSFLSQLHFISSALIRCACCWVITLFYLRISCHPSAHVPHNLASLSEMKNMFYLW